MTITFQGRVAEQKLRGDQIALTIHTPGPRYPNKREAVGAMTQQHWADYHAKQARLFRDESARCKNNLARKVLERAARDHQLKAAHFSQQAMCIAGVL